MHFTDIENLKNPAMIIRQKSHLKSEMVLCCPCPKRSEVRVKSEDYYCNTTQCPYSESCFPKVSGQPILIDFSDSVCTPESFESIEDGSVFQRKRSSLHKLLKRVVWGTSKKTIANTQEFIKCLTEKSSSPTILIVGGGAVGSGSEALYQQAGVKIISFDIYASLHTDFVADAHSIPIHDGSVDGVWIQAVLEHVLDPSKVVEEIHRVLLPGGIVYSETPFMQQVHEKAYDFTRFTESGHRWLFKNFELIDSGAVLGSGTALLWSIRYFFAALFRAKKIGSLFAIFFFWLRFFDSLTPKNYVSDAASSVFFLGRKSDQSLSSSEIIAFYRGVQ
jgi:SAM-dependent methyltransferase